MVIALSLSALPASFQAAWIVIVGLLVGAVWHFSYERPLKTLLPAGWFESGQARSFCERVTAAATVVVLPLMVTALIWAHVRLVAR